MRPDFISILLSLVLFFLIDFLKSKGQNFATKQDIAEITNKIEQVKADIGNDQEIIKLKRELKYEALLNSLNIIDAFLSNLLIIEGIEVKKQFSSAIAARECHNNLILTCEYQETLDIFGKILFEEKSKDNLMELPGDVNKYRNLVRKELGFGEGFKLDDDKMWFANVIFEQ